MKKIVVLIAFIAPLVFTNCVSSKVFQDLESRYAKAKNEIRTLEASQDSLQLALKERETQLESAQKALKQSHLAANELQMALAQLKEDYVLLGKSSDQKIQESIAQNNALLKEIALKESALSAREERVDQLEELIALKEAALSELKQRLSDALLNFKGKGLTVEQRNGKVYVSMENKLLFQSGRWDIEAEGKKAIRQLAAVLQDNPDISILIEGHTDNVPFSGQGGLESNWDLSTKRATAVVNILLENDQLLPQNLTAAGRSEYIPIAPNSTPEGRASNRRIEVILSPQWDEINALLNN
ncbi:MAG: OmpA family protein [Flavobacteriaceae bacterium]|jgi:chemotaxis protein MotB|nr:OmpA family protein [Flavobacteriaceae bacterium]